MRVVSWNMGCGSPRFTGRYRKAHDEAWRLLLGFEPDVVLVQEALLEVPEWVHREGSVAMQPAGYDGQDSGCGVLVRRLPASPQPLTIPGSYVAAAEVTVTCAPWYFASVHVGTEDQKKSLQALLETLSPFLSGRRFVIGGDFNAARHWDVVYKNNTYGWFFDALKERGFHDCYFGLHGKETQSFWGHNAKEPYQLDHFFIPKSEAASVRDCRIIDNLDTRRLSDHGPILLDLA
jgi:endonuclease/exonuclease/phosphatase family metal-dependent hydrolase